MKVHIKIALDLNKYCIPITQHLRTLLEDVLLYFNMRGSPLANRLLAMNNTVTVLVNTARGCFWYYFSSQHQSIH